MRTFITLISLIGFNQSIHAQDTCTIENYQDFIYDSEKTDNLIKETGTGCNLQEINFGGAHLTGADLRKANLTGVNFYNAYLTGANLSEADLLWANLTEADLTGVDLTKADIRWAYLYKAHLIGADLTETKYNTHTTMPISIIKKTQQMILVEDD